MIPPARRDRKRPGTPAVRKASAADIGRARHTADAEWLARMPDGESGADGSHRVPVIPAPAPRRDVDSTVPPSRRRCHAAVPDETAAIRARTALGGERV